MNDQELTQYLSAVVQRAVFYAERQNKWLEIRPTAEVDGQIVARAVTAFEEATLALVDLAAPNKQYVATNRTDFLAIVSELAKHLAYNCQQVAQVAARSLLKLAEQGKFCLLKNNGRYVRLVPIIS